MPKRVKTYFKYSFGWSDRPFGDYFETLNRCENQKKQNKQTSLQSQTIVYAYSPYHFAAAFL